MVSRVILTGGGTGGHVYPAIAVAEQLQKRIDTKAIIYIGVSGHLEERLAKSNGLKFIGLDVIGLPRKISPQLLSFPLHLGKAFWQAMQILDDFKPTAILGTGGYAAAPALAAAIMQKVPIVIHEPDSNPGLVNKVFTPWAKTISLGMEASADKFKRLGADKRLIPNGNPVSQRFLNLRPKQQACLELGLDPAIPTVLVTGGSQGAKILNETIFTMLAKSSVAENGLPFQILHQIGDKNWAEFEAKIAPGLSQNPLYKPKQYFDNMALAYAACDLSICRSGAMTIAELAITGTPAIFIPYPFAAADHQTFNAQYVASKGAAKVIMQNDLNAEILLENINQILLNQQVLHSMREKILVLARPNAARDLADQLLNIVG